MDTPTKQQGLEGVVASATRLSSVDGEAGVLLLAGFPVEEIAPRATFEEVTWLLWQRPACPVRGYGLAFVARRAPHGRRAGGVPEPAGRPARHAGGDARPAAGGGPA